MGGHATRLCGSLENRHLMPAAKSMIRGGKSHRACADNYDSAGRQNSSTSFE